MADKRVIQCNYTRGTNIASAGARAYVVLTNRGNGHERIAVLVRSRGGRWVEKWEDLRRLDAFRVTTLPPQAPLYEHPRLEPFYDPDTALEQLVDAKRKLL